jgi:hypothetical protein
LLSISFLYFSGTTQALVTYVNIGTIKDLIIKIFPKIVKFLFVHKRDEINHSIKISQLADDTTLFFNSKSEIPLALNEIEIFCSFSGLIMNKDLEQHRH